MGSAMSGLFLSGCDKDGADTALPMVVETLTSPANNADIKIADLEDGLLFEWTAAVEKKTRADMGVIYKVMFYLEESNFEEVLHSVISDNEGADPKAFIPKNTLSKIALNAGAAAGEKAILVWCVLAESKGGNRYSEVSNRLYLTRPDVDDYDPAVVTVLEAPADDARVDLATVDEVVFDWEAATWEGGGVVTYEVVFDRENGDFSSPLRVVPSSGDGVGTTLVMSRSRLDGIAASTDTPPGGSVKLLWAVRTASGTNNFTLSESSRTITVTRPTEALGFVAGDPLYINGAGSEAGHQFRFVDSLRYDYEIYTRIEAGQEFYFSTAEDGSGTRFAVNSGGTAFDEIDGDAAGTAFTKGAIYRIRLDFKTYTMTVNVIDHIWLRWCQAAGRDAELNYAGMGVWKLSDHNVWITTPNYSPNGEDRYKFFFQIDGLEKSESERWGIADASKAGRYKLAEAPAGYRDLGPVGTGQWAGAFRYPADFIDLDDMDRWFTDIILYMNNDYASYTHEYVNWYDGAAVPAAYVNSIFTDFPLPDPDVIKADDGNFYLYATEAKDYTYGKNTPIMRSRDLVNWTYAGSVFTDATHPYITSNPTANLWAPSINRIGSKYVIYYSQPAPNYKHAIGVATSDSPTGPFTDHGKLIDSDEQGVDISIDAYLYQEDGRSYLFWGSFRKISVLELTADGLAIKDKATQVRTEVAGGQYEAAVVLKRDGYYYLIVSTGDYSKGGTYRLVVGRSDNIMGPYINKAGQDMMGVKHELILEGNNEFSSPGHCSRVITDDEGQDWILYHAYPADKSYRCLMLDKLNWVDGWPTAVNKQPTSRAPSAPVFR